MEEIVDGSVEKREEVEEREQGGAYERRRPSEIEVVTRFMRPSLWRQLPEEVLELVIARVPVTGIEGLRRALGICTAASRSNFERLCADARPHLFALMRADPKRGKIRFKLFDSRFCTWHNCEFSLAREYRCAASVADGGLVCFVPGEHNLPILVCNPLTNEWRELPPRTHVRSTPRMVQLVVEFHRYRLTLVGSAEGGDLGAEVYDSATREWSVITQGFVSGYVDYATSCSCYNATRGESLGVYDCARRRLRKSEERTDWLHFAALNENRVFFLEAGREIVEFSGGEAQRRVKIPRGALDLTGYETALHACDGLLLVTAGAFSSKLPEKEWRVGYPHHFYLYEMSSVTWWTLPSLEKEYGVCAYDADDVSEALMCKLNWWARP